MGMLGPFTGQIKSQFSGNQNLVHALRGKLLVKPAVWLLRQSFSDRETIDVKAVASHYENSYEIIIPRDCDIIPRYDRCK